MTRDEIIAMVAEDRAEWGALCSMLDAHGDGPLHDPESAEWTPRDVYAHLARWISHSTDEFESWLATKTLSTPSGEDDDTVNARWRTEDSGLSLEQARGLAQGAFDRRISVIEAVAPERWDRALDAIAHADDAQHFRAHRGYIIR